MVTFVWATFLGQIWPEDWFEVGTDQGTFLASREVLGGNLNGVLAFGGPLQSRMGRTFSGAESRQEIASLAKLLEITHKGAAPESG